jgi:predicted translin family RNA/ssDNA-binding protein
LEDYKRADQAWQRNFDLVTEQKKRILEQLESLQTAVREFADEISEPSFDDTRIEWVEVQIDREALAGFRSLTTSFPAKSPPDA